MTNAYVRYVAEMHINSPNNLLKTLENLMVHHDAREWAPELKINGNNLLS